MKSIRFAIGSFLLLALFASASRATTARRTWVSGGGSDSNTQFQCPQTKPCRTFGAAVGQTAPGGEVVAMDSADYDSFTITQAVTVEAAPGVHAGIAVISGNWGVNINAGPADTVILRGLTFNSTATSFGAIGFWSGGSLDVEKCTVDGFSSSNGLLFAGSGSLEVKDSIFRGNAIPIDIFPTYAAAGATAVAYLSGVQMDGSGAGATMNTGLWVSDNSQVTVKNSRVSGYINGFVAETSSSSPVELNIEKCIVSGNDNGVTAQSYSTGVAAVRVSNSTVADNDIGLVNAGSPAVLLSRTNNTVQGNGANQSGVIGTYPAN
jgi:hypothetical protein